VASSPVPTWNRVDREEDSTVHPAVVLSEPDGWFELRVSPGVGSESDVDRRREFPRREFVEDRPAAETGAKSGFASRILGVSGLSSVRVSERPKLLPVGPRGSKPRQSPWTGSSAKAQFALAKVERG
jgi:hypothetical protein